MNLAELESRFPRLKFHMACHYGLKLDQIELDKARGYWIKKEACKGRRGGCPSPIHSFMFNDLPMRHTVSFFDDGRDARGRWSSLYATWKRWKEEVG